MESTWEARDLPVLDAIVRYFEEQGPFLRPNVGDIARATGIDGMDVWKACRAMDGVYIELQEFAAGGNPDPHRIVAVSPEARVLVGQWPSPETYLDRLLAALEDRASTTDDPDEKSRLRKIAEGIRGMSRDVAVSVVGAALTGAVGAG